MTWALVWRYFEKVKAKIATALGRFLQLRETLLDMRERIDHVYNIARAKGQAASVQAAGSLRSQIGDAYQQQQSLERTVAEVRDKIRFLDQTKSEGDDGLGFAISVPVALTAIGIIAAAAAAIAIHTQRVNYLNRLLDDIERKVLTPSEAAELRGGLGFGGGIAGALTIAAVVGGGLLLLSQRRGRTAR